MSAPKIPPLDVAVIIAAWNAQDTLERAVRSALSQTGVSVEVIVVDDASCDDTLACVMRLAERDMRVKVLSQTHNQGPAAARNRALDCVTARYATPLDSDDFMEPGRLARLLEIAQQEGWDLVGDDLLKVDESFVDGPRRRLWSENEIGTTAIDLAAFIRGNLSSQHGGRGELGFLKPLIRTAFIRQYALRYRDDMRLGEDYVLYATALLCGARFCLTDPAGYIAVGRPDSLSGRHSARDLGALVRGDRMLMRWPGLGTDARRVLRVHYVESLKKWHWMRLIDAVKARDVLGAAQCFAAPPQIIAALFGLLGEQIILRSTTKLLALAAGRGKRVPEKSGNP